jgi:selenocysteine lyase/cysteine desulfurase
MARVTRRDFLARVAPGVAGCALAPQLLADAVAPLLAHVDAHATVPPAILAEDEAFWTGVRRAFDAPVGVVNLDHGNINPAPRAVIEDHVRHLRAAQQFPAERIYALYENVSRSRVRPAVARLLGVPADEIATVRNATEAMDTVLLGLPMKAGDEIVCSAHDYYAMLDALEQRRARDGVVLRVVRPPVPLASPDALGELYEREIGARTRLVLVTHPSNLTGQLAPVRRIADAAHRVGAELAVDGAQSMALLPYTMAELGADYYGASLHKWLMAPVGAGVLWMRPEHVDKVWPLVPPPPHVKGMDRFVWSGTYPEHVLASAVPALALHERLGTARKAARVRHLTRRWRERAERLPGARFYTTGDDASSCGLATLELAGIDPEAVRKTLWERDRIFVQNMGGNARAPEVRGVRVTPNVYTAPADLDRLVAALERVARKS